MEKKYQVLVYLLLDCSSIVFAVRTVINADQVQAARGGGHPGLVPGARTQRREKGDRGLHHAVHRQKGGNPPPRILYLWNAGCGHLSDHHRAAGAAHRDAGRYSETVSLSLRVPGDVLRLRGPFGVAYGSSRHPVYPPTVGTGAGFLSQPPTVFGSHGQSPAAGESVWILEEMRHGGSCILSKAQPIFSFLRLLCVSGCRVVRR